MPSDTPCFNVVTPAIVGVIVFAAGEPQSTVVSAVEPFRETIAAGEEVQMRLGRGGGFLVKDLVFRVRRGIIGLVGGI